MIFVSLYKHFTISPRAFQPSYKRATPIKRLQSNQFQFPKFFDEYLIKLQNPAALFAYRSRRDVKAFRNNLAAFHRKEKKNLLSTLRLARIFTQKDLVTRAKNFIPRTLSLPSRKPNFSPFHTRTRKNTLTKIA